MKIHNLLPLAQLPWLLFLTYNTVQKSWSILYFFLFCVTVATRATWPILLQTLWRSSKVFLWALVSRPQDTDAGSVQSQECLSFTKQVEDLHTEQQKGLWNSWALSSIAMDEEIAAMKIINQNLSTLGGKQRAIKYNKINSRSLVEADINKRSSFGKQRHYKT